MNAARYGVHVYIIATEGCWLLRYLVFELWTLKRVFLLSVLMYTFDFEFGFGFLEFLVFGDFLHSNSWWSFRMFRLELERFWKLINSPTMSGRLGPGRLLGKKSLLVPHFGLTFAFETGRLVTFGNLWNFPHIKFKTGQLVVNAFPKLKLSFRVL